MTATVIFIIFTLFFHISQACKGCLQLDEHNFNKIIARFDAILVKFDIAYPYGEKQEAFEKLAEELVSNERLILAQVGVKDYGARENQKLAAHYGLEKKDDLPAIKLFLRENKQVIDFPKKSEWNVDTLRHFVKDNTDVYVGLPGCLEVYDKIAADFVGSTEKDRLLQFGETQKDNLDEEQRRLADIYLKYMRKIEDDGGANFVQQETKRLAKLLKEAKITDKKKQELNERSNILRSFIVKKDEL